jgi:chemotaxis protein methyltransferase CheR
MRITNNARTNTMPALQEQTVSEAEFRQISDLVYRHCRINLHDGKKELVRARLAKRMRGGGFTRVADYMDHVLGDASGAEFTSLIDSLSTNLTSFYREVAHFNYLKEHFLPALAARKRKQGAARVLVWSAGCSSGEEPYSLAMLLSDELPADQGWDVRILATDISTRILEAARAGSYPATRVQAVPPAQRQQYMETARQGGTNIYKMSGRLRQMIRFRHLNLMDTWPFKGPFDFIFCRNVMIYFDKPTQEKLVNRYYEVLQSGGLLFTGHSESLTGIAHRFKYVEPTIYARN